MYYRNFANKLLDREYKYETTRDLPDSFCDGIIRSDCSGYSFVSGDTVVIK